MSLFKPWFFALFMTLASVANAGTATDGKTYAFTDAQLKRFIKADVAVNKVRQQYIEVLAKGQREGSDNKWNAAAMQVAMGKAIKNSGMKREVYNRIAHAMAKNRSLRKRINALESH